MMAGMMKSENVSTLPELMDLAAELGVRMTACQMTMGIMGVKKEELRKDILFGGVATYIETASESKITLFI
jgi:peroxiredoxin family protein